MMMGNDLEGIISGTMGAKNSCRKCATEFTFEEGAQYAAKNGIKDNVVMCPKCNSVYEVNITPRGVTLLNDVTSQYPKVHIHSGTASNSLLLAPAGTTRARTGAKSFVILLVTLLVVAAFLSFGVAFALRTPQQHLSADSPLWPADLASFSYDGQDYEIYNVPTGQGTQQLALVKKGRNQSQFLDPANPGAGPITWEGNWRTLETIWIPRWSAIWISTGVFFILLIGSIALIIILEKQRPAPLSATEWKLVHKAGRNFFERKAENLYQATEILRNISAIPGDTFYVVETPDGTLGRDMNGFYTEAAIRTKDIVVESRQINGEIVECSSLIGYGNMNHNHMAVAAIRKAGKYAQVVLLMKCGNCGYESPVETQTGLFSRECYRCGATNKCQRGTINIVLGGNMIEI